MLRIELCLPPLKREPVLLNPRLWSGTPLRCWSAAAGRVWCVRSGGGTNGSEGPFRRKGLGSSLGQGTRSVPATKARHPHPDPLAEGEGVRSTMASGRRLPHELGADVPAVIEDVAVVVDSVRARSEGIVYPGRDRIEVFAGEGDAIDKQELIAAAERPLVVDAIRGQQVGLPDERDIVPLQPLLEDQARRQEVRADGRIDVHVVAIHAGLELAAGPQAGKDADPDVGAELNAGEVVRGVGVVLRAGRNDGRDRGPRKAVGKGAGGVAELLVEDEVPHADGPGTLVAAVGRHPAAPSVDLKTVEGRLVIDLAEVGVVELCEAAALSERLQAESAERGEQVSRSRAGPGMRGVVEHSKVRELHAVRRSDLHCRREAEARLVAAEIEIVGGEHDRPVDAARGEVRPAARVVALEHHVIDGEVVPPRGSAAAVGIGSHEAEAVAQEAVRKPGAIGAMMTVAAAALLASLAAAVGAIAATHGTAHGAAHRTSHLAIHRAAHLAAHRTAVATITLLIERLIHRLAIP